MDIKEVKEIFSRVEILAIDTQVLRTFINKVQKKELDINKYSTIFDTLTLILDTSNLEEGSSSVQVSAILDYLDTKISDAEFNTTYNITKNISKSSTEKDLIILSTLVDIKKDLDLLKNKPAESIFREYISDKTKIEMDSVFVQPEINIKNISGRVNVEEVVGENASSKLNKLKQLRGN